MPRVTIFPRNHYVTPQEQRDRAIVTIQEELWWWKKELEKQGKFVEAQRVVQRILGELTERDRRLLQAVMAEEDDRDTLCSEYGVTREHLRVLVHRAKQSFKSFYLKHLGEPEGRQ